MSIAIKLYTFTKRENSTAQPSGGTKFDCNLKDETSIINPEILISASSLSSYNYAYISDFGRYYFIRDIVSVRNNLWRLSLECDVLATYKSQIGDSAEYVLRSSSDYSGDIIDNLYPMTGNTTLLQDYTATAPFSTSNITNIIGIINNNNSHKFGAVQYYAITESELGDLMAYLLSTPEENQGLGQQIMNVVAPLTDPEFINFVKMSITDPQQYIVESYMLPYKPPIASSGQTLKAGWFNISQATGDIIGASSGQFNISGANGSLTLPDHPQAADRGNYLNLEPFSKYWLYLGPFGKYPLDSVTFYNTREVSWTIDGDLFGNITCKLYCDSKIIDTLYANVKCNFPVGQVSMDVSRAANSAIGTAITLGSGYVSGDPNAITSGLSGIISTASAMMPQSKSNTTQGSFINTFDLFRCYAECHEVVDEDNYHRGKPYCAVAVISTLPGYLLVADPDISISGTQEENEKIKAYMAGGFYYE